MRRASISTFRFRAWSIAFSTMASSSLALMVISLVTPFTPPTKRTESVAACR